MDSGRLHNKDKAQLLLISSSAAVMTETFQKICHLPFQSRCLKRDSDT
jgi:hypothetical protein